MPIYEYQCKACDIVTDFLQKMSDVPMLTCPECNTDALKKLVSAPRFRLAGSGWYETDFKEGDNKRNLVSSEDQKTETKASGDKGTDKTADKAADKISGTKAGGSTKTDSRNSETKSTKTESKTDNKTNSSSSKDNGKAA